MPFLFLSEDGNPPYLGLLTLVYFLRYGSLEVVGLSTLNGEIVCKEADQIHCPCPSLVIPAKDETVEALTWKEFVYPNRALRVQMNCYMLGDMLAVCVK